MNDNIFRYDEEDEKYVESVADTFSYTELLLELSVRAEEDIVPHVEKTVMIIKKYINENKGRYGEAYDCLDRRTALFDIFSCIEFWADESKDWARGITALKATKTLLREKDEIEEYEKLFRKYSIDNF